MISFQTEMWLNLRSKTSSISLNLFWLVEMRLVLIVRDLFFDLRLPPNEKPVIIRTVRAAENRYANMSHSILPFLRFFGFVVLFFLDLVHINLSPKLFTELYVVVV